MPARPVLRTALATAALLAGPLTACGSSSSPASTSTPKAPASSSTPGFADESGRAVLTTAMEAMKHLKEVHIKGSVVIDEGRLLLDVRRDAAGTCAGTMTQAGGTVRFVATAHGDFLKADRKFWQDNAGKDANLVISMLHGKWAKLPNDDELDGLCDISKLLEHTGRGGFFGAPKGTPTTLAGQDVVRITVKDGADRYSFFVGAAKPHYLLRMLSEAKKDAGDVRFSEFDKIARIHVPSGSEAVAISS